MAGVSLQGGRPMAATEATEEPKNQEQEWDVTNPQIHSMENPGMAGGQLRGRASHTETSQGTIDEMGIALRLTQQYIHQFSKGFECFIQELRPVFLSLLNKERLPGQEERSSAESDESQGEFITVDLSDKKSRLNFVTLNHVVDSADTVESPQVKEQEELNEQEREGREQEQKEEGQGQKEEEEQEKEQVQEKEEQVQEKEEKVQEKQEQEKEEQVQEKQEQEKKEQVQEKQEQEKKEQVQEKQEQVQEKEEQVKEKQVQEKEEQEKEQQVQEKQEQVQEKEEQEKEQQVQEKEEQVQEKQEQEKEEQEKEQQVQEKQEQKMKEQVQEKQEQEKEEQEKEQQVQEKQEQEKEQQVQEEQEQEKKEQVQEEQEQKEQEQKEEVQKEHVQEKEEQRKQVQEKDRQLQELNEKEEEKEEVQGQEEEKELIQGKEVGEGQEQKEQEEQEQKGQEGQKEKKPKEPKRQKKQKKRKGQKKHEQKEQQEQQKEPINSDTSSSKNQTEVSAPERVEERKTDETAGTASPKFVQGWFRSITNVGENVQDKEKKKKKKKKKMKKKKKKMDKQREQNLPPSDNRDQVPTDSRARHTNARGKKSIKLPVLILLSGCLTCQAAALLTVTSKVHGRGRPEQGQSYSLTCEVEGLAGNGATSSYVWYKDDAALSNEEEQVLYFAKLSQGDAGKYECEPQLSVKEGSLLREPFQLQVLVFENMTMVPEVEVEEGETVLINCSVNSVPTAQLVWTMDHEILRMVESNFDSLVLHNASQYHLKVFVCQASNREFIMQFLEKYTQIRIKGTYEIVPQPVLSSKGLSVLGQPFRLICTVLDLPQDHVNIHLTYTWFKDSREIPGQSGEVLQLPSLTREDGGEYQCRARNGKPQTTSPESHVFKVHVLLPPRLHMEPATPDKVIRHAAGEELTLTCKVTEAIPWVPHHGYSWSYLPSPEGQLRPLDLRESTLRLGPLTREDSGQYFCQARNDLEVFQGRIPPGNASVTVDVVYLETMTLTPDLEVNEGDRVTLACSVDSNPAARIAWVVDGREVRDVIHNTDHFVLERAACSDSKTYTCRASNAALPGLERNASTNLRVNCSEAESSSPPSPPSQDDKGKSASGPNPSPLLWLLVLQLVVPILVVILLFRKKRYLKKLMCSPENPPEEICMESAEPLKPEPAAAAQEALDSDASPLRRSSDN